MTPEVKERIEQIQHGIVPEGYKRTKAGIVPIEWEEVRIGDVLTQRKTLQCISEDAPLLSFTIEEGVIDPVDKKSNKRDFLIKDMANKKFALTEVGDIIYNPANLKFGAIHRNNLCRGVVSPIYGIFYGKQDSVFMGYLLHNQRFIDYAKIYTEGTVEKLKTLKADTFLKLKITLPPIDEQRRIAEILSSQDKMIKLREEKIELLQHFKKVYLSKLFPKAGESAPKWRFPEHKTAWEWCKFDKCVSRIATGLNPRDNFQLNVGGKNYYVTIKNFEHGHLYLDDKCDRIDDCAMKKIQTRSDLQKDDILFASIGRVGDCYLIQSKPTNWNINESVFTLRPNKTRVVPEYLFHTIQSSIVLSQILNSITGSTFKSIKIGDLKNAVIPVPEKEEQEKIGALITNLDQLIILNQRELAEAKKHKESLMQLLLTGIVRT